MVPGPLVAGVGGAPRSSCRVTTPESLGPLPSRSHTPLPMLVPLLLALSLVPHLYVFAVGWQQAGPSLFLFGLAAANLFPVAVGYHLTRTRFRAAGVGALVATFLSSSWALWDGLLHPRGSTASLIFLFLPLWNSFLVGPLGGAVVALVARWRASRSAASRPWG